MLEDHLVSPTPDALTAFLHRQLHSGNLVQVAGEMEVEYTGRAMSMAEAGQYLVMVKGDGSLQVHGPKGVKPMNWQPKTDSLQVTVERGYCVLRARRRKPDELVTITMLLPSLAQAIRLQEAAFALSGSEAQMQEALARHPDLIEPGLTVLNRELLTAAGGIDLYARDREGRYVVVELKRGRATQDAVSQLARYVDAAQRLTGGVVRGILAAPEMTGPARLELERRVLEFVQVTALPVLEPEAVQRGLFD